MATPYQLSLGITRRMKLPPELRISEHELMNWCIGRLQMAQFFVWRNNAGKLPIKDNSGNIKRMIIVGRKGVGDIIGISPNGKFCNFEIKVGYNKLSPHQEEFAEEVERRNGIHRVFRTTEECDAFCKEYVMSRREQ